LGIDCHASRNAFGGVKKIALSTGNFRFTNSSVLGADGVPEL
jgi:hypothetical protein